MKSKLNVGLKDISYSLDNSTVISFDVMGDSKYKVARTRDEMLKLIKDDKKTFVITIEEYRSKRSLDQNALMWALLDIMAQSAKQNPNECYRQMLISYGPKPEYLVTLPDAKPRLEAVFRVVEDMGESREVVNDKGQSKQGRLYKCVYGSSTYDTKEMTKLIDGIFAELHDMGIAADLQADAAEFLSQWNDYKRKCEG